MKQYLIFAGLLAISMASKSQNYIHASIQQGSASNKVDVMFRPEYNNAAAEFVNYLQFSIAIPSSAATGVTTPVVTGAGPFAGFTFTLVPGSGYVLSGEKIYSWTSFNPASPNMTWTSGTAFAGITVTFNGGTASAKVKLIDLTNLGGGTDNNSMFVISTSNAANDPVDYGNLFYPIAGGNGSITGLYGSGDLWAETNLLISLPVNLLNFSGYKNGTKNTLNWTVASEVNNKGFDVQRSTDGINYSSLGFVNSSAPGGFTNSETSYTFNDLNPAGKKQYYRLNQIDIDGRSKLSPAVIINGDKPKTLEIGGLFPNPARETVNVIINTPQKDNITLLVMDIAGKTVKQKLVNVDIGSNTVPVDIAGLAQGSYVIKVLCKTSDCELAVGKFNKQ